MVCGHDGFTIRGQCVDCAPDLHAEWHLRRRAYAHAAEQFQRETGASPLERWDDFEQGEAP